VISARNRVKAEMILKVYGMMETFLVKRNRPANQVASLFSS